MATTWSTAPHSHTYDDEYARSKGSKLRFKSSKSRKNRDIDSGGSSHDGVHRRRHHDRTKRRKYTDDTNLPNASSSQSLDPETAFRESLLDAMADDEGALFWEGVYGQPIPKIPPVKEGPTGKLEAMTEDEYAAYVRAEMYKKTHQHLMEEKERRDRAKKEREKLTEQVRQVEDESRKFRRDIEESLKRGRKRREKAQRCLRWAQRWKDYEKGWEDLHDRSKPGRPQIPWPVPTKAKGEITKEQVEEFFLNAPTPGKPEDAELSRILKAERVRWHPDKFQQKFGGQKLDDATIRDVTTIFQIIDRIWTELRDRKS